MHDWLFDYAKELAQTDIERAEILEEKLRMQLVQQSHMKILFSSFSREGLDYISLRCPMNIIGFYSD